MLFLIRKSGNINIKNNVKKKSGASSSIHVAHPRSIYKHMQKMIIERKIKKYEEALQKKASRKSETHTYIYKHNVFYNKGCR